MSGGIAWSGEGAAAGLHTSVPEREGPWRTAASLPG